MSGEIMSGARTADWGGTDAIWKEPAPGAIWDPASIDIPGLDRLRAFLRGELPVPPIQHLTGITPVEVGVGTATFSMPASEWYLGGHGAFLGGTLALLADAPLACAIISGLPQGVALTTQELSLHFLRGAGTASEKLIARGHIIHGGRSIGLSEVHIHDAFGRLLAYGSSRCVTLQVPRQVSHPPIAAASPLPEGWVAPLQRPLQGAVTPSGSLAGRDGLQLMQGWADGSLPMAPLGRLFGLRFSECDRGSASVEMPASPWLANAAGTVYGGALSVLADIGLDCAAVSILSVGMSFRTLDLKINFLRPVRPDGRMLTARSRVFHSGKQMIVTNGDVVDADGKQVVVATGTRMLVAQPFDA
jgi:uncharacterized protein (TIGR00369 family)